MSTSAEESSTKVKKQSQNLRVRSVGVSGGGLGSKPHFSKVVPEVPTTIQQNWSYRMGKPDQTFYHLIERSSKYSYQIKGIACIFRKFEGYGLAEFRGVRPKPPHLSSAGFTAACEQVQRYHIVLGIEQLKKLA